MKMKSLRRPFLLVGAVFLALITSKASATYTACFHNAKVVQINVGGFNEDSGNAIYFWLKYADPSKGNQTWKYKLDYRRNANDDPGKAMLALLLSALNNGYTVSVGTHEDKSYCYTYIQEVYVSIGELK